MEVGNLSGNKKWIKYKILFGTEVLTTEIIYTLNVQFNLKGNKKQTCNFLFAKFVQQSKEKLLFRRTYISQIYYNF